jgi:hypothetical protein
VPDLAEHIRGLDVGPHGSSPFVIVRLPDDATVNDYRKALASAARQGICRIGVFSPAPAKEYLPPTGFGATLPQAYVPIYRIVSVKPDYLISTPCVDRFPAWTPPW